MSDLEKSPSSGNIAQDENSNNTNTNENRIENNINDSTAPKNADQNQGNWTKTNKFFSKLKCISFYF